MNSYDVDIRVYRYMVIFRSMQSFDMEPLENSPMILHYILKDKDGGFVAHCVEIPPIMVYGKNKKEIEVNINKAITSYFTAFPEKRREVKREEIQQIEVTI